MKTHLISEVSRLAADLSPRLTNVRKHQTGARPLTSLWCQGARLSRSQLCPSFVQIFTPLYKALDINFERIRFRDDDWGLA